ncbi:hypothetical protein FHS86_003786 [Roseimarinus sediminis]|jgi:hypothetical protein
MLLVFTCDCLPFVVNMNDASGFRIYPLRFEKLFSVSQIVCILTPVLTGAYHGADEQGFD